jgi:hypothetical protein
MASGVLRTESPSMVIAHIRGHDHYRNSTIAPSSHRLPIEDGNIVPLGHAPEMLERERFEALHTKLRCRCCPNFGARGDIEIPPTTVADYRTSRFASTASEAAAK